MPIAAEHGNLGTEADGTPSREFCTFCYRGGAFTRPDLTLEGMIALSVEHMRASLGFSREKAEGLSREVIPGLRRWRRAG
jgi:hypothetical protein